MQFRVDYLLTIQANDFSFVIALILASFNGRVVKMSKQDLQKMGKKLYLYINNYNFFFVARKTQVTCVFFYSLWIEQIEEKIFEFFLSFSLFFVCPVLIIILFNDNSSVQIKLIQYKYFIFFVYNVYAYSKMRMWRFKPINTFNLYSYTDYY